MRPKEAFKQGPRSRFDRRFRRDGADKFNVDNKVYEKSQTVGIFHRARDHGRTLIF